MSLCQILHAGKAIETVLLVAISMPLFHILLACNIIGLCHLCSQLQCPYFTHYLLVIPWGPVLLVAIVNAPFFIYYLWVVQEGPVLLEAIINALISYATCWLCLLVAI